MTSSPPLPSNLPGNLSSPTATLSDPDRDALLLKLRRKLGTWVDWAEACQTLQKSGLKPHEVFEETGFEAIHQNQIIVAWQVYQSMVAAGVNDGTRSHFTERGSDALYELRILSQAARAQAAEFLYQHGLESDQVPDIAKAIKEFSYRNTLPQGFTDQVGDAVAYRYWQLARQQADMQARSRLIALGLRFAASDTARQSVEKLLTDFTVSSPVRTPSLPLYRLETDSDLPCLVPVAGALPLPTDAFNAVPVFTPEEPFGIVKFSGAGAYAPVPGWQVILVAEDPVAVIIAANQLPSGSTSTENLLVVVDRAKRDWDASSYFIYDDDGQLGLNWFADSTTPPLLGRVLVMVRPKRILDEDYTRELWQIDE
ncbi:MAG: RuBisCO accumulation factor 1 [Cyanobacteria bacterium P01_A01_bin.105]